MPVVRPLDVNRLLARREDDAAAELDAAGVSVAARRELPATPLSLFAALAPSEAIPSGSSAELTTVAGQVVAVRPARRAPANAGALERLARRVEAVERQVEEVKRRVAALEERPSTPTRSPRPRPTKRD